MNPPPAGRPRKNPKAARETLAVRVDPADKSRLMAYVKRTGKSAGEIVGILIRKHLT